MENNFENIFSSNGLNYVPGIPLDLADPALSRSDNYTGKYGIDLSKSWYQNHKNTGKGKNLDNKIMLEKGALRDIIETTKNLTPEETIAKLELYQGVTLGKDTLNKSGKDTLNMFEMIALYQRSIQHLTTLKIKVDARFGPRTFENLMKTQKDVLHFEGKAADGIPGKDTTKAIIKALTLALNTAKKPDNIKAETDKLEQEAAAIQKSSYIIISNIKDKVIASKNSQEKIIPNKDTISIVGNDPNKSFYGENKSTGIVFAYITEKDNITSVWGEIDSSNLTRPLILMEKGKIIYVGELSPNNNLIDKLSAWPVGKREKIDYKYMPKIPENRSNIIATVIK